MTIVVEETKPSEEETSERPYIHLWPLTVVMFTVALIWRLVDVFVLGLGDTWLNIFPSKLGPLLVMIIVLWQVYDKGSMQKLLGLVNSNFRAQLITGLFLGVSFYLCIDIAGTIFYHTLVNPSYDLTLTIVTPNLLWYTLIFFFVNAVFEETLFRGLLQNTFKTKMSVGSAILFSAVIFGVWHAVWPVVNGAPLSEFVSMILLSGILGAFFGVFYEKFSGGRTLIGTITCHTLINFLNENFKVGADPSTQGPDFVFNDSTFLIISVVIFFGMMIFYFTFSSKYRIEQAEALGTRVKGYLSTAFGNKENN
ncbi:MAG: CPBP family intramembrane glutamic endopeptidase [Candidatus Thorarchaeota archaeon]